MLRHNLHYSNAMYNNILLLYNNIVTVLIIRRINIIILNRSEPS